MASVSLFVFFVLSHLLLLHSAEEENSLYSNCSFFKCGKFGSIGFPFFNSKYPFCRGGLLGVNCDGTPPTIQLELGGKQYEVINISYTNTTQSTTHIKDPLLLDFLKPQKCESITNLTFPSPPSISYEITSPNQTLFKCNRTLPITSPPNFKHVSCLDNYNIYYSHSNHSSPTSFSECSIIQLPQREHPNNNELFSLLSDEINLEVHVSDACSSCHRRGGLCELDEKRTFYCIESPDNEKSGMFELVLKVHSIMLLRSQRIPT